ncbi:hypothetical protein Scep_022976 [Stephania cephalantha]|uniref:Uncharacterized protein n=1 Tax=Stephania cephalantha TaxID=152367 RepID=A0AAP0F929_9MAGN
MDRWYSRAVDGGWLCVTADGLEARASRTAGRRATRGSGKLVRRWQRAVGAEPDERTGGWAAQAGGRQWRQTVGQRDRDQPTALAEQINHPVIHSHSSSFAMSSDQRISGSSDGVESVNQQVNTIRNFGLWFNNFEGEGLGERIRSMRDEFAIMGDLYNNPSLPSCTVWRVRLEEHYLHFFEREEAKKCDICSSSFDKNYYLIIGEEVFDFFRNETHLLNCIIHHNSESAHLLSLIGVGGGGPVRGTDLLDLLFRILVPLKLRQISLVDNSTICDGVDFKLSYAIEKGINWFKKWKFEPEVGDRSAYDKALHTLCCLKVKTLTSKLHSLLKSIGEKIQSDEIVYTRPRLESSSSGGRRSESGPTESGPSESGPSGSGPSESGPSGSGPSESGPSESGPSDSSPSDSGPSGSGPSDCSPSESGPSDSGPSDSGPSESGPSESSPSDSGPSDKNSRVGTESSRSQSSPITESSPSQSSPSDQTNIGSNETKSYSDISIGTTVPDPNPIHMPIPDSDSDSDPEGNDDVRLVNLLGLTRPPTHSIDTFASVTGAVVKSIVNAVVELLWRHGTMKVADLGIYYSIVSSEEYLSQNRKLADFLYHMVEFFGEVERLEFRKSPISAAVRVIKETTTFVSKF